MLVSFIIPAYNAVDTIVRCLESIRNLTLEKEDYEIIVIDDASSDNTIEVIEQYCQKGKSEEVRGKSDNLTLLRQAENHRQGAARNRGLKEAKGEYICFVDADDVVKEGIVKAIRLAKERQTDMIAYHLAYVDEKGNITKEAEHLNYREGQIFSGIEMQNHQPYWFSGPVAYIYSKGFLERVDYPFVEDVLYEDSDFVAVHLFYAQRMAYSSEPGYFVYEREGSTTRHTSYKNVADYLLLGERMLRFHESIVKSEELRAKSDEVEKFADSILEGACWNISKSCKRLLRLKRGRDVRAFYERIDATISRVELINDKDLRRYYWNAWTGICIGHKRLAIMAFAILMPMYRLVRKYKS